MGGKHPARTPLRGLPPLLRKALISRPAAFGCTQPPRTFFSLLQPFSRDLPLDDERRPPHAPRASAPPSRREGVRPASVRIAPADDPHRRRAPRGRGARVGRRLDGGDALRTPHAGAAGNLGAAGRSRLPLQGPGVGAPPRERLPHGLGALPRRASDSARDPAPPTRWAFPLRSRTSRCWRAVSCSSRARRGAASPPR